MLASFQYKYKSNYSNIHISMHRYCNQHRIALLTMLIIIFSCLFSPALASENNNCVVSNDPTHTATFSEEWKQELLNIIQERIADKKPILIIVETTEMAQNLSEALKNELPNEKYNVFAYGIADIALCSLESGDVIVATDSAIRVQKQQRVAVYISINAENN